MRHRKRQVRRCRESHRRGETMKDIEDKLAKLLMDYGVLKNADADRMAKRIAGMFEKEQDDLEVKWVDVTARLVTAERERDHLAAKCAEMRDAIDRIYNHNE